MNNDIATNGSLISSSARTNACREPVAIEKGPSGFIFHYKTELREWPIDFEGAAVRALELFVAGQPIPIEPNERLAFLELRKFGLLMLGDHGDIIEPVTLSLFGEEVKRALTQMQDARPGMTLAFEGEYARSAVHRSLEHQGL
ncbi:hypothetical protein [Pseudomonas baetica]|uniref:hypothetical protein n=1 Tax=Pseudomonas baetica TaxID=674054 RepID=UPI002404BE37|nr:hypothetical protein [Pseudomonas baetica]MDF9778764.1 hypothetical protein [Pseudomonas baetica]